MQFTNKTLLTLLSTAGLSLAAACGSSNNGTTVTCFDAAKDACLTAKADYSIVSGVTEVGDVIENSVQDDICNGLSTGGPAMTANTTLICPTDLAAGTVLGTCAITLSENPDAPTPTISDVYTITGGSATITVNDSDGATVGNGADWCNGLDTSAAPGTDSVIVTTTWTAAP